MVRSNNPAAAKGLSPAPDREVFGMRLRSARKKLGRTLAEVAELSGVSITTISRAERGQLALSYEKFSALARTLGMDIGALFAQPGARPVALDRALVTRAGQGVVYRGTSLGYEFLAAQATGKQMSPIVGTVYARRVTGPDDFARHEGEEFAYVLSGAVEVHFDTGRVVRLVRGDSVYFDSRIGHAYISVGRSAARIVGATTSQSTFVTLAREPVRHGVQGSIARARRRGARTPGEPPLPSG